LLNSIEASTLRILRPDGKTVGTGFLVAKDLVVTCAHVITDAGVVDGDTIQVQFTHRTEKIDATVVPEFWLDIEKGDVAILRLATVPEGVIPLRLAPAAGYRVGSATPFHSFGYAIAADVQGIIANGKIDGYLIEHKLLQLQTPQADHGISGAPVLTADDGVVGMITKGHIKPGRNQHTTFATPSETIWQICPQLKPAPSIPPQRNPIVEGIRRLPYDYAQRIQNFWSEYLGNDKHPVPFGGRDDALHMLNAWFAETTPYLLLAAPAGRGKSALLVRWLDSLKERGDLALAFVPISIRFGTNLERVFYAALAARLAFLHGDEVPASPETSTAVYRGLVCNYLSKPLANGRTLLVVLDGLDEAADWQAGADFMPAELPSGVRVVVSARFLAGDSDPFPWLRRLNWERGGMAAAPALPPLDQVGVADVLLKMGCPLDEISRNVDIVAELYRLSEGDPLLVSLYVDDLWARGEAVTRLKPEDLKSIQPGYKGYFDRWWEDQKKLWGKEKPWLERHVRAVRNLLACALGALFLSDIQSLDPELESDYITDALEVLQRFIIGDNQIQGYTFSHPKLGQYFWEALTPNDQTQVERCFLDWGERTLQEWIEGKRDPKKKNAVPAYVVRNYSAHLARADQPIEKYLVLIHHQQWAQAWFTVEGAYGGYLQDVERVWEECKKLDRIGIGANGKAIYFGKQIRCGLIEASLHSLAGNVSAQLLALLVREGIWTLPQTWVFIRLMPKPYQKADAISAILPQLKDEQLVEALTTARTIDESSSRARILRDLTERQPELIKEALETAQMIHDERDRARALSALVEQLPETELDNMLTATCAIRDETERASVLSTLAEHLPEQKIYNMLTVVRAIDAPKPRAHVLIDLAQDQPELMDEALEAVWSIWEEKDRANALSALVGRLPEGKLVQVLDAALAMKSEWSRVDVLIALAQRMPNVIWEALESIQAIKDESTRTKKNEFSDEWSAYERQLTTLADHLPEEKLTQVLEAALTIQSEWYRANALSNLAQRLPKEQLVQVIEAARVINDASSRARVLSALIERLPEAANETFNTAREISDARERAQILTALIHHLPDVIGEALDAAREINKASDRAHALLALVECLPQVIGEALEVTREISDTGTRANELIALTDLLPEVKEEAINTTRAISDPSDRAKNLFALAQRFPEMLVEALESTQIINDVEERASVLLALALHLPEVTGEAFETAQAISNPKNRALALSALAQHFPEMSNEALEAAGMISDLRDLAEVLSTLAKQLPEAELGHVLTMARAIKYDKYQADVLIELALRLPKVNYEALVAARAINDNKDRASAMCSLVKYIPDIASEAIEATQTIKDKSAYSLAWGDLASNLPEKQLFLVFKVAMGINEDLTRELVLDSLAERLPEELLEYILAYTRVINDRRSRANMLCTLAKRLPKFRGEALVVAQEIQDDYSRADALANLVGCMPEVAVYALDAVVALWNKKFRLRARNALCTLAKNSPEEHLWKVLEMTRSIDDAVLRAKILNELSLRLPDLADETLETILEIQDKRHRAYELIDLAQRMPKAVDKAFQSLQDIQNIENRARQLSTLIKPLLSGDKENCYFILEKALPKLSNRTRDRLLSDIEILLPIFIHLGTADTPREIYEAVRDVTTWWP
jgi:hypothetical protein